MRRAVCLAFVVAGVAGTATAEDAPSQTPRSFWIEASGGWAPLRPTDLNARAAYGEGVQRQLFDAQLDALQRGRAIRSWDKAEVGARPRIDGSWNAGLRATYRISPALALSLGYQRLSARSSSDRSVRYTRAGYYNDFDIEETAVAPEAVAVGAHAAGLGIEVRHPLGGQLEAAAFLRAGPLFATFEYQTQWSYVWSRRLTYPGYPSQTYTVFTTAGQSQEKGHGLGVAFDAGLRLQRALGGRLAWFVEGAYAYQNVSTLAGSGSEELAGRRTTWEGDWIVQRERIAAPWGSVELENPSARLAPGQTPVKARDFRLDLSGFQLRSGVSFRF